MLKFATALALWDFGRELVALAWGLLVAIGLALLLAVALPIGLLGLGTPAGLLGALWTVGGLPAVGEAPVDEIPPDQLTVMQQVAAESGCGLGWQVLAAIARVESGFGRHANEVSSAGAYGYGQFMEPTWAAYGGGVPWRTTDPIEQERPVGQRRDSTNFHFALPAMDRYLCSLARETNAGHGPADTLRQALFFYSHRRDARFDANDSYVVQVLSIAAGYNRGPAATAGFARGGQAVEVARGYLGVPYLFGGTNPAVGLDCSELVQLVYRRLGMNLPRTAQQQYEFASRITEDQLQPGDLVFFARTYPDPHDWITHVGIYIGRGLQINAPTEGQVVSIQPVFSGFWGVHYAGAGRVVARSGGSAAP
jgi:cell wall-associated NlpC family hydrolase